MVFQTNSEVKEIKPFQVGGEVAKQQIDPQKVSQLFKQLEGKLPTRVPSPEAITTQFTPTGVIGAKTVPDIKEIKRREAFEELQQLGFTQEQIGGALAFEAGTKPPSTLGRTIGATAGGLSALALGTLIPAPEEAVTIPAAMKIGAEIIGAGLGGGAGAGIQAAIDPDDEFTTGEFLRVAGEEALLEGLSIGTVSVGRFLTKGAKQSIIPAAKRLNVHLADAGKRAGFKGRRVISQGFRRARMRLLPAQMSENQLIDTIQGIGEGSLIGSNVIFQFKRGQRIVGKQLQKDLLETFFKGTERKGTLASAGVLFDTIKGNRKAWRETGAALYGALDDKGIKVSTKALTKFSNEEWKLIQETGDIASIPNLNTIVKKAAKKIDTPIEFEAAHRLRSTLLTIERNAKKGLVPKPQTARVARKMVNNLTGSMESAAKTKPDLFRQYRRANNYWRAGNKRFDNDIIRKLTKDLKNHPQLAALAVFHPNTAQEMMLVKKAAGTKAFNQMRSAWLEQLLKDSASKQVGEEGELLGKEFLEKFRNMGDDTLAAIFSPEEIKRIEDLGTITGIMRKKTGGVGGSLKILQGIAAFGLVAAPLLPEGDFRRLSGTAAGMILLGPAVVARMMTNPVSARLLSEGFKLGTGTRQGVALTARLVRNVLKTRAQLNKEEQDRINNLLQQERATREPTLPELRGFGGRGF